MRSSGSGQPKDRAQAHRVGTRIAGQAGGCVSQDPKRSELFLVEGDSRRFGQAARDRVTQAICRCAVKS